MNRPAIKRGFHYNPTTNSLGIFVNGIQVADYPETRGRTYYVNNITGSSANDGLSWGSAVDQVSTAITLSEAYRTSHAANNQRVRNQIIVQGTETAYASITALPQHCDVIGLGDEPRGSGAGIARIGTDADTVPDHGVDAVTCRGSNFINLQFQAGSAKDAFQIDNLFRCHFENCAFMSNSTAADPTTGLLVGRGSGATLNNCHWGGASSNGTFAVGISLKGTHWHNCRVTNCHITGVIGILVDVACVTTMGSEFKDCFIGSWTAIKPCTLSVDDNGAVGNIKYIHNHLTTNGTLAYQGAERWVENWITNGVAPVAVTAS